MPYVNVVIQDKTIPAKIDLGYKAMLSLSSDFIKDIDKKKWVKHAQAYDKRGRMQEKDIYEVKNLKIGDVVTIHTARIEEVSLESMREDDLVGTYNPEEDRFGKIGWGSYCESSLFFDCKHSIVAFCDGVETFKKQGYPFDSFAEAGIISNPNFIAIEVLTEGGPLRCMLDTGSTFNLLNKDLGNCHEDTQELSSFKIGEKEFGPLTFHRIKSQCPLDIDVILGMEFFFSNLVFIDLENKKVYLSPY